MKSFYVLAVINQIFDFELSTKSLVYSNEGFHKRIFQWFNGDNKLLEDFNHQKITTVYNKWTHVTTSYNTIRGQRPKHGQKQDSKLVSLLEYFKDNLKNNNFGQTQYFLIRMCKIQIRDLILFLKKTPHNFKSLFSTSTLDVFSENATKF